MRVVSFVVFLGSMITGFSATIAGATNHSTPEVSALDNLDRDSISAGIRSALPSSAVAVIDGDQRPVAALVFAPSGQTLVLAHEGGPNKGDPPGTIELWDLSQTAPRKAAQLDGHRDWISSLAMSPNGKMLVSGGARFDQSIHFWDLTGPRPKPTAVVPAFSHWWHIAMAFSPDGKWLATVSGSDQGPVQLWDVSAGPDHVKQGPVLSGPAWGISAMAFSPDGRFVVASLGSGHHHPNDGTLLLWKRGSADYELVSKVDGKGHEVSSLAFSHDGSAIVTGYAGGGLRMWDLANGVLKEKTPLRYPDEPVRVVTFLADGDRLFSGKNDGGVDEWDAKVGKSRHWRFEAAVTSLAPAPRGPYLAVGLGDGPTVILHLQSGGGAIGNSIRK